MMARFIFCNVENLSSLTCVVYCEAFIYFKVNVNLIMNVGCYCSVKTCIESPSVDVLGKGMNWSCDHVRNCMNMKHVVLQ